MADTIIVAVRTTGEPRFVTLGKKIDNNKLIVSFFGFAVQAKIDATTARTIRRARDRSHAPWCFPPARL